MNNYFTDKNSIEYVAGFLKTSKIELIKILFLNGLTFKGNYLDFKTTEFICNNIYKINIKKKKDNLDIIQYNNNVLKNDFYISITGNVDNGKTTLFDFITKSNKSKEEYLNITQKITIKKILFMKKNFFFFDLPGHDLFIVINKIVLMNSDIVFFLISIEQNISKTITDLINFVKEKKILFIICFNKYDKFKKQNFIFKNYNCFYISAKNGYNIKNLILKSFVLVSKSHKIFNNFYPGYGIVINSELKNNILINNIFLVKGCIESNDYLNFSNESVKVENIFLNNSCVNKIYSPKIFVIKNIQLPLNIEFTVNKKKEFKKFFFNNLNNNIKKIFIKTSNYTTASSIYYFYNDLKNKNEINVLKISIGNFNDNDLKFCVSFNCDILLLDVELNDKIKKNILKNNILLKSFSLINDLIDYIKNLTNSNFIESITGEMIVKNIFPYGKTEKILGCYVQEGFIDIKDNIKIFKNLKILYIGKIDSIKINKKNIRKIKKNQECGIYIKNFKNIEKELIIKSFKKIKI